MWIYLFIRQLLFRNKIIWMFWVVHNWEGIIDKYLWRVFAFELIVLLGIHIVKFRYNWKREVILGWHWTIIIEKEYLFQLISNKRIFRFVFILQTLNVVKDFLELWVFLCSSSEYILFRLTKALFLHIFDLIFHIV